MELEDHGIHLEDLEAMVCRVETELKNTSQELNAWVGGYQHLQGIWTHKEAD